MKIRSKFRKIGDSYYLIVPKSIIDVYDLLKENYIFEISVYKEGKTISYKRVGKEEQTKIGDFEEGQQLKGVEIK